MDAIASLNPPTFNDYLKETQNTICGRNPICVMLQAAEHFRQMNNHTAELRFLKYSQSNKVSEGVTVVRHDLGLECFKVTCNRSCVISDCI